MTLPPELLDPREAGQILKAARKALGLTQGQVIEAVGIPNQSYLSALENGRYNVANSEYFPALAQHLRLSVEQVREINPSAVITLAPDPTPRQPERLAPRVRSLPQALQDAIDLYGRRFEDLRDPAWQQYLAGFNWREGQPDDPEAWLDLYRDLTRAGVVPGEG